MSRPVKYLRRRGFTNWKVLAGLILASLCGCGWPSPPNWKDIVVTPEAVSENVLETTDHLVIYLDVSSSMAGYVSPDGAKSFGSAPDGQTVFSHTLQELRNIITSLNTPVSVVFRQVHSSVSEPSFNDLELNDASINRGIYGGGETNIAGAISLFSKPVTGSQSHNSVSGALKEVREDKPAPAARFHVLITDGVQSTRGRQEDTSCASGSDYVCVKNAIFNLLKSGWAGTILGIKSEFRGKIYSEVSKGHSIYYESRKQDPKTCRPFYLYIFSSSPSALDNLVESILKRLQPLLDGDGIREYVLTSPYSEGFAAGEMTIPKESSEYLEKSKAKREEPVGLTLRVSLNTEKTGPMPFTISVNIPWSIHARGSGTPQELASLLRWELNPIYPKAGGSQGGKQQARYPEVKILNTQVDSSGQVVFTASAQWPQSAGDPKWRAYRLEGRLDVKKQQAPPWVYQWSTNLDTTIEAANKTLNLETTLSNLWRNTALEKQVVAEVYLRVGPK